MSARSVLACSTLPAEIVPKNNPAGERTPYRRPLNTPLACLQFFNTFCCEIVNGPGDFTEWSPPGGISGNFSQADQMSSSFDGKISPCPSFNYGRCKTTLNG